MTEGPRIIVRPARHEDFHDVVAIGDVYHGMDYLPAMYHMFLDDPNVHPVVAVINGKVVGFGFNHVVDGGLSVTGKAGRVHKDYRRLGVLSHISEINKDNRLSSIKPPLKKLKYLNFVVVKPPKHFAQKAGKDGYFEVLRKKFVTLKLNVSYFFNTAIREQELFHIGRLSKKTLSRIFQKTELSGKLFPKRRIFNRFVGSYRLLDANIKHVINQFSDVYASSSLRVRDRSFTEDENGSKIGVSRLGDFLHFDASNAPMEDFSDDVIDKIDTISFSQHYPTIATAGWVYKIDLYSTPGIPNLDLHIRYHLQAFKAISQGQGVLIVTFSPELADDDKIISCLRNHGIVERHPDTDGELQFFEGVSNLNLKSSKL